jgi:hypothetical protein
MLRIISALPINFKFRGQKMLLFGSYSVCPTTLGEYLIYPTYMCTYVSDAWRKNPQTSHLHELMFDTWMKITIGRTRLGPYKTAIRIVFLAYHGCQMVCMQTKNSNLGNFWRAFEWKMLAYFWPFGIHTLRSFGILYGPLLYLVAIWYIFSQIWYIVARNIWQPCNIL